AVLALLFVCSSAKVASDRFAPPLLAAIGVVTATYFLADLPRSAWTAGFTAVVVIWGVTGERGRWGRWFAVLPPLLIVAAVCGVGDATVFAGREPTIGNHVEELIRLALVLLMSSSAPLLRQEVKKAKEEREAAVAEAANAERARIARELHDVVSHHVTVMVLQAEGARAASSDSAVTHALSQVVATGRTALNELRRLLGVLRQPDETAEPELEPQPDLDQLPNLLEQLRSAGLKVDLTIDGEPLAVEPGVGLSAYRIVQEALTNTLRHSGSEAAHIRLTYATDAITVAVTDEGGSRRRLRGGSGTGLIGMQERAASVGGSLEAGPAPGGGYVVRATLPMR
ncbi:MAG TPA: histidine kinase, partial [Acidimicrobiales bacterium]|nr:histidine kinase [Acidimicrobiales bacterium]